MIYYEEFGDKTKPYLVLLHGANLVHSFIKEYDELRKDWHIIVPHITGYGNEAGTIYTTNGALEQITALIQSFNTKVTLCGFSLGAQLAFVLVSTHQELFNKVICISPWIIKKEPFLSKVVEQNKKGFKILKSRTMCKMSASMLKLPKDKFEEFFEQCKNVQLETIVNSVDNKIDIESYPQFAEVKVPVLAMSGIKEYNEVTQSLNRMKELNPNFCETEICPKASHNIPTKYPEEFMKHFNKFIKE